MCGVIDRHIHMEYLLGRTHLVAFGTSAELMVNVVAKRKDRYCLRKHSWIQLANLGGSRTALMSGLNLNDQIIKRDIPLLLLAS